ncbi:hypothetical protein BDB00DRAFT_831828 [Zychaea mexicana]|uniref:uncharacterized protein n=1 Tax=Zychaea mexicana TaxID=64656 RepID=UPI0022FDC380|nr:uncharacterized protein BDB00DRAFT_831828 [Zychaea mexicana]KAI9491716.1 hypothetical protein BDB00DRAFT_831828 [Zychaea mexicana]
MLRTNRLVYFLGVAFILFFLIFIVFPYLQQPTPSTYLDAQQKPVVGDEQAQRGAAPQPPAAGGKGAGQVPTLPLRYLSWFPHGDFAEQHEAFRNAIRIAYDTKRIIIAPMLRLGHPYPWLPFIELARRYEAQDKTILRRVCRTHDPAEQWRTELEDCKTMNEWTEIPWSLIFDLSSLEAEFGVQIIERTRDHNWGMQESAIFNVNNVEVVDPMSFAANGSSVEHGEQVIQPPEPLTKPLKKFMKASQLASLDATLVQFGALSSAARYNTRSGKGQSALRRALNKRLFVTPNNLLPVTLTASQMVEALGGRNRYSSLHLNLAKFIALDARIDSADEALLSNVARKELMNAVVLEIFGDIPINQAVSAAMPILEPSRLSDLVAGPHVDRRELLDACVEYRRTYDKRYPIYYIVNDIIQDPMTRPDLFGPLTETFPCMFSKADMSEWGIIDKAWAARVPQLADPDVDYEALLAPVVDILMASNAYSFFELPQTRLTRFISWQPKRS